MCNPTGDYASAHTMYTTYVTVSGNALEREVMNVFYQAQKNGITLPKVFRQVHGGTTVSPSQQQGKDPDRADRVTAGYATLKAQVSALSVSEKASTHTVKKSNKTKFSASAEQMAQHQQKKTQNKTQTELNKKLQFLSDKRTKNPNSLSKDETALLSKNGF